MNIWHDVEKSRVGVEDFIVVIEISRGSKIKYELDKQTGLMRLDRVLKTSMQYPANYGFIPRTLSSDGDPLDVFVLGNESINSGTIVQCYPVGVINLIDDGDCDEKVIAIPYCNFHFNQYKDVADLPPYICPEIEHFLSQYKANENKKVVRGDTNGADFAKQYIFEAILRYKEHFETKHKYKQHRVLNKM
ncbi:MAG: inorganic diphosphatase [Clostridiales bacterium]|jgi:inorganic pyrophosphatase|nr:inorganic diphosphatase [Clostridiales bacterium]